MAWYEAVGTQTLCSSVESCRIHDTSTLFKQSRGASQPTLAFYGVPLMVGHVWHFRNEEAEVVIQAIRVYRHGYTFQREGMTLASNRSEVCNRGARITSWLHLLWRHHHRMRQFFELFIPTSRLQRVAPVTWTSAADRAARPRTSAP